MQFYSDFFESRDRARVERSVKLLLEDITTEGANSLTKLRPEYTRRND